MKIGKKAFIIYPIIILAYLPSYNLFSIPLYIEKGFRVGIVQGERENFKLTTPFDLTLAEMMLSKEERG